MSNKTAGEVFNDIQSIANFVGFQESEIERLTAENESLREAAEMLWVVLASVSGGNWDEQSTEWQEAAERWRDNYFAVSKGQSDE